MESLIRFTAPPSQCGYLPDRNWSLEYEHVASASAAEYGRRLEQGWHRFGHTIFRPRCPACTACRSLRVVVEQFRPDRSQRRARKANDGRRGAAHRLRRGSRAAGWPCTTAITPFSPISRAGRSTPPRTPKATPTRSPTIRFLSRSGATTWAANLVGVGYVDVLPTAMSAIYFFYEPAERQRSLGTWNVLRIIEEAARRRLPHVYLGYFVGGCRSLAYKACFVPNEPTRRRWRPFRT